MSQIPNRGLHDFLARQLNDEPLPGDGEQLQAWLARDPEHEKRWNILQRIWSERTPWMPVDQERAQSRVWALIRAQHKPQLSAPRSLTSPKIVRRASSARFPRLYAALAAVFAVSIIGVWQLSIRERRAVQDSPYSASASPRIFATAMGQRASIQLVDGTQVSLGPASTLRVGQSFNRAERVVSVDGEAYFEVTQRPSSPFIVRAGGTQTRVLGTKFSVSAYRDDPVVRVVVADGKVAVRAVGSAQPADVTLSRNELVQMDRHSLVLTKHLADAAQYMAWVNGGFEFVGVPLRDVVRSLERWYDVDIDIADSSLANIPVTASSSSPLPLSEVLTRLSDALDVRFTQAGREIRLFIAP